MQTERSPRNLLEHNHDTPGNGPLLGPDEPTTLARRCQFRDVNGDLSGADADTESVDDAANNQHANVLRSTDKNRPDAPGHGIQLTCFQMRWNNEAYQMTAPIMIDFFRPSLSERKPETRAPNQDPPAIEAVMPPWTCG